MHCKDILRALLGNWLALNWYTFYTDDVKAHRGRKSDQTVRFNNVNIFRRFLSVTVGGKRLISFFQTKY